MSNNLKNYEMWLVGVGYMGREYAKVLDSLNIDYLAFGRGIQSSIEFENTFQKKVIQGGIENVQLDNLNVPKFAIVAVDEINLYQVTKLLITKGVTNILVEKPGSLYLHEFEDLKVWSSQKKVNLFIAYNRRFYQSVKTLKNLISEDETIKTMHFEFTEWGHKIKKMDIPKQVRDSWFLANSTHVIDLAFYLAGVPKEIQCITKGNLDWSNNPSIYIGSGTTIKGVPFTYNSNWNAPGRWSIELTTSDHRFKLSPLEELKVMSIGEIDFNNVEIDYHIDKKYKPGLFNMVKNFISGNYNDFCSIDQQLLQLDFFNEIHL